MGDFYWPLVCRKWSHSLGLFSLKQIRSLCHLSSPKTFYSDSGALFLNRKCACKGFFFLSCCWASPECARHLSQVLIFWSLFSLRDFEEFTQLASPLQKRFSLCTKCLSWLQSRLRRMCDFVDVSINLFKTEIFSWSPLASLLYLTLKKKRTPKKPKPPQNQKLLKFV